MEFEVPSIIASHKFALGENNVEFVLHNFDFGNHCCRCYAFQSNTVQFKH